jgi:hypothetical protein
MSLWIGLRGLAELHDYGRLYLENRNVRSREQAEYKLMRNSFTKRKEGKSRNSFFLPHAPAKSQGLAQSLSATLTFARSVSAQA